MLGPLDLGAHRSLSPRDRVVLEALVVEAGRSVTPDQLADALWGATPPASWSKVVQGSVMRLRRVLGSAVIETTSNGYRLGLGGEEIDAREFERLVRRGRSLVELGDHERAVDALEHALALWRGRPFSDLDSWAPAQAEVARLDALRRGAEESLLEARLASGDTVRAVADGEGLVAAEPLSERRWALLALALYQAGRQGDALRAIQRARVVLAEELGLNLGPDLSALEQRVLQQDPGLAATTSAPPVADARCPYRGLVPYDVDDDEAFFGRDREVETCLRRLTGGRVLVVVGASGSGKSSLVRAGVAGRLRRGGQPVGVLTPGADPLGALAATLATSGPSTILVIDQLEELVTLGASPDDVDRFLDALVARLAFAPVVVALRGDHVGSMGNHPAFARQLEDGLHLIGAMTEEELRAVIVRPAAEAGLRLEPGLAELLLRDVRDEPGGLPLLSFALAETWANREGRVLTVDGYLATGGLRQAIATSAERLYEGLPVDQRSVARAMFLRLVTPAADGEAICQRVDASALVTDDEHRRVVDAFVRTRLVVAGDSGLELAHEALVREWPRLRGWLDEDREGLRLLGHLHSSAQEWDRGGRDPAELQRGARLAATLDWVDTADPGLDDIERRYLDASREAEEAELAAARERARRDAHSKRRLRALLVATAVLLVGVLIAGLLAVRARDRADASGTLAEARRLGTQALVVDDYDQALLLALEGQHLSDTAETRANLLKTIQRSPDASAVIRSDTDAFLDVGVSADGKSLLVSGSGASPSFAKYDVSTHKREAAIPGVPKDVSGAVSPDGRLAAMSYLVDATSDDPHPELHVVDVATFTVVGAPLLGVEDYPLVRISFSPDGRYVAAVTDNTLTGSGDIPPVAEVWDVTTGARVLAYEFAAEIGERDIAFLPDSKRVLVAGADGTSIIDVASGSKVGQIDGAYAPIAVSPDGKTVAAGLDHSTGTIGLFDLPSAHQRAILAGHRERVVRLAFSPDGTTLASGADDRLVMLWDPATGLRHNLFEGHAAGVNAVAFSPDGKTLWSAGDDRAIFAWDLTHENTLAHRLAPNGTDAATLPFRSAEIIIEPGGHYVAFPADDRSQMQILDVATGALSKPSSPGEDGNFEVFSPDGAQYVTVDDETLRLWDRATGAMLAHTSASFYFVGHKVAFTPDGRQIVTLQSDADRVDSLIVLDATTLEPVGGEPLVVGETVRAVSVTPDGRSAVVVVSSTTHPETKVVVVDLETRRIVRSTEAEEFERGGGARNDYVAPDGRTVGLGNTVGDVDVVDAMTGEVSPVLHAHDGVVESVTFAPDKATFVTTGRDGVVELWDRATQKLLGAVSPLGPNRRVRASFLDADKVLLAYDMGEVLEWDPRPTAWEAYACKLAGRNLSQAEWSDLFPGQTYRQTCPQYPAGT